MICYYSFGCITGRRNCVVYRISVTNDGETLISLRQPDSARNEGKFPASYATLFSVFFSYREARKGFPDLPMRLFNERMEWNSRREAVTVSENAAPRFNPHTLHPSKQINPEPPSCVLHPPARRCYQPPRQSLFYTRILFSGKQGSS